MQIGRIEDLSEPQSFSQADMSSVSFGLQASATQSRQLLDLGSNGAERFVPIIFGAALAANDGVYELLEVAVEADPNLEAAGLRLVSVSARCENQGRQVANSQLLVRGDNRNRTAAVGVTGPLYRVAIPDVASTITSFNAGPAGFEVAASTLPTLRGDVRRLVDLTKVKAGVTVASTANITLSGTQTVDGVSVSVNDTRVLVKNQTTKSQNGIYLKKAGAWSRATDADGGGELSFAQVGVASGTANGGTTWFVARLVTIGTTAYDWQQYPAFGLRESDRGGPVSITYSVPLANWFGGACTISQGGTVVTGSRLAATGTVTIDNGLIRLVNHDFAMASGSPLAYGIAYNVLALNSIAFAYGSPSILANTPDFVSVRYRFRETSGSLAGSVDYGLVRGSRTLTAAVSYNTATIGSVQVLEDPADPASDGFLASTAPTSATGAGYTASDPHLKYAPANDANGNRVGLSYAGEIGEPLGAGLYTTATAEAAQLFGIHAVVGGGATLTGNDQLFGMDRAWFAMVAQQTSAGVV